MVGYLVAGFALSTMGYEAGSVLKEVADIGVTILLFTIGLKLKVRDLLRPEIWAGASLHMLITVAVFAAGIMGLTSSGLSLFADLDWTSALLIAFALSFSSTVFAVKILEESGRSNSLNGITAIGVLIMQDVFAVLFLTFSTGKIPSIWAIAILAGLPLARWIFMRMMNHMGHGELQVLFGFFLAFVIGAAAFEVAGLKEDLGALIVGMLLAPHARAGEMAKSLMNIKDFLLVGFFLEIGLNGLPTMPILGAALILVAILPLKIGLFFLLFTRFKLKARTSLITSFNLANYSEFGLIVGGLAVASGWLTGDWLLTIAVALSISFVIAAPLNRKADCLFDRIQSPLLKWQTKEHHPDEEAIEAGRWEIIVIGMGRIGVGTYDYFTQKYGPVVLGLDFCADTVDAHLEAGRQVALADVTDPDFWRKLPETDHRAKLVVLTMNNIKSQIYATQRARELGYEGEIAAVAHYDDEVQMLQEAGVNTAHNVFSEAGFGLASHIIEEIDLSNIECMMPAEESEA
jgi:predicted Kef-type K+ transport protein